MSTFQLAAKKKRYEVKMTRPYSPWYNGKVERNHIEDDRILYQREKFMSKKELIEKVSKHEKRYNNTAKKVLNFRSSNEVIKESLTKAY